MTTPRSIYLGKDTDPTPVFRDEVPDAFDWPEGAVMAVTFERERFGHMANEIVRELPRTEFFGKDGWPLELPEARKSELSDLIKLEFQVYPRGWRRWSERTWQHARLFPKNFARARAQGALIRGFLPATNALALDAE
jgi:hypothetical protein